MHEEYEEVVVPPARPTPPAETERFIPIEELPALVRNSFPSVRVFSGTTLSSAYVSSGLPNIESNPVDRLPDSFSKQ